ncbi:MAG: TetR/AcrR family transcriptional regulator [Bacteroidota bacterium]|nr:TetR/AcrR family transcriptional regulator [Bacteroidota bacterium]
MEIRERIKQKADELYRRYGVKSVTMDEIASQLGVSKKTIYQFFDDKNQLVDAVFVEMLDYNKSCCRDSRAQAQDAVHELFLDMDNLQEIMLNMNPSILFDIERGHPNTFKKFAEFKYHFLFQIIKKNIERGIKEELYRGEMNADVIAKMRLEMIMLPFNEELFPKSHYSLAQLQQELLEFFLFGMITPKGHKLITKYQKERQKKQVQ